MTYSASEIALASLSLGDIVLSRRDVLYPSLGSRIPLLAQWPLVVLTAPSDSLGSGLADLRVAPISTLMEMASSDDLRCEAEDGPLGAPFLVELWNQRAMLAANIERKIGRLSPPAIERLITLHNSMIGVDDVGSLGWSGACIETEEDPRIAHQRTRAEEAGFLSDPVEDLLHAESTRSSAPMPIAKTYRYALSDVATCRNAWAHNVWPTEVQTDTERRGLLRRAAQYVKKLARAGHAPSVTVSDIHDALTTKCVLAVWVSHPMSRHRNTEIQEYSRVAEPLGIYSLKNEWFEVGAWKVTARSKALEYRMHETILGFAVLGSVVISGPNRKLQEMFEQLYSQEHGVQDSIATDYLVGL